MKKNQYYVVTMYRYGNITDYSYVAGISDTESQAFKEAKKEEDFRGGKYSARIVRCDLNEFIKEPECVRNDNFKTKPMIGEYVQ
jgi:hypothetical protein